MIPVNSGEAKSSTIDAVSREVAQRAAAMTESERSGSAVIFAEAVRAVHQELKQWRELRPAELAAKYFPKSPLTIVPLALALATIANSAEVAILLATNVGGDSDSVASIAGGIIGARCPDTIPAQWHAVVETVNGHDLVSVADSLGALHR